MQKVNPRLTQKGWVNLNKGGFLRFTDRSIKALKPKDKRYEVSKDNGYGLGVRVMPTGQKAFIYRYKYQKRSRGMVLGSYPELRLEEANLLHAEARSLLKKGIDPGLKKITEKKSEIEAETVSELIDIYIKEYAKKYKKSWETDQKLLDKKVRPKLGRRKVKDVRRREIKLLLQRVAEKTPVLANRLHAVLRKMFNFAIEEELIESNPSHLIKPPGGKERSVDRVLTDTEIRHLWRLLYKTKIAAITKLCIKFQLVTAQRSGEVINMTWNDINDDWWTIPVTKNGLSHRVPLSSLAIKLIEHAKRYRSDDRVFPVTNTTANRAVARSKETLKVNHFTPHDLRRTAASKMASEGVSRLVISKILNHKDGGVTAVYDRHSYDLEKKRALDHWSERLLSIITH